MNKLSAFWNREGAQLNSGNGDWLAVMRIGVGIALMAKVLSEFGVLDMLYGSHGLVPIEVSSLVSHGILPTFTKLAYFTSGLCSETASLKILFATYFVFALLMTVGLFTRISVFICWLFQLTVINSSLYTSYGYEYLVMAMLFYSLIFPTGRYYSMDRLIRGEPYPADPDLPIYHLVIQIHLCFVYFATGVAKEVMPTWHDGSYLWSVTSHPQFSTVWAPMARTLLSFGSVAAIMSWFIVILEIVYPFGLWFRRTARPLLIFTILMHVYIAVAIGLWIFGWVMIVFNLAAFGDVLRARSDSKV
jgi:hypothetical protein